MKIAGHKISGTGALNVLFLILFLLPEILLQQSIAQNDMDHTPKYTNHLAKESSHYLLQHAHQPVDWYPWGAEALEKAKKENKLILISIGYSACHWCHVMAHESFDDPEIAKVMNENFVCIKVDREERPDVDQVYMDAVQAMTGSGGWPLNCFALPNGDPVYGGTYFRPNQWLQVLEGLALSYRNNPDKFVQYANELKSGLKRYHEKEMALAGEQQDFSFDRLDRSIEKWSGNFDPVYGGNKGAPKFPMPAALTFLLDYSMIQQNKKVFDHVQTTLNGMIAGGIYDQVGGGFARYSTDRQWKVPHFEKMLYDNAQLISLLSKMYRVTANNEYRDAMIESIAFVGRELSDSEGGFYSALDADSEGEEGKFYVWSAEELLEVGRDKADMLNYYFGVGKEGAWEGKNILLRAHSIEETAKQFHYSEDETRKYLDEIRSGLLTYRSKRVRPGLDDKILCSWNAMMIIALLDAFQATGDEAFYQRALQATDFIQTKMMDVDGVLFRTYKNGKAKIPAFLDDYAFLLATYFKLYQSDADEQWLVRAEQLLAKIETEFANSESPFYNYRNKKAEKLYIEKTDLSDNVIASANSVMAENLFLAKTYFDLPEAENRLNRMLTGVSESIYNSPGYYANWARISLYQYTESKELVLTGPQAVDFLNQTNRNYLPGIVLAASKNDNTRPLFRNRFVPNETLVYYCVNKTCRLPRKDILGLLNELMVSFSQ